jgi:putative flippase GtrA
MIDADTRAQFLRYATVGLVSNLLLYLAYLGLTTTGFGHKTAMTLLYATGVLITFVANRSWSFEHQGFAHAAFVRYVIAYILGYLINFSLLWIAVDQLHLPHQGVQAVAVVLVAISLFLMHKYWVFAPVIRNDSE